MNSKNFSEAMNKLEDMLFLLPNYLNSNLYFYHTTC